MPRKKYPKQSRASQSVYEPTLLPWAAPYLARNGRFTLAIIFSLAWLGFSVYFSLPWIHDAAKELSWPAAIFAVAGIAFIPGYINAFLLSSLFLDRPHKLEEPQSWPEISAVIAAYNEEESIAETVAGVLASDYPGKLEVIVVDDGSEDKTASRARSAGARVVKQKHAGKAKALNRGLSKARYSLLATLDADTLLTPQALRRATARLTHRPRLAAVAGAVMVRNSRVNWLTRLQEWDYQFGIGSIKRVQGMWGAALVAQGSFSLLWKEPVESVGGWKERSGEDIVLSWALLADGWELSSEPTALAWTSVPENMSRFSRQRIRWARGMFESIREHGIGVLRAGGRAWHGALVNMIFPWVDAAYLLCFIPGLVLAAFGNFIIAGPWTFLLLPLVLVLSTSMFIAQRKTFRQYDYHIRRNRLGLVLYLLFYQVLVSGLSLVGYGKELIGWRRKW